MLHKPRGVVTTRRDPGGPPDGARSAAARGAAPAALPGRAASTSTPKGLVLLTNDGALAQRLLHPSFESEKEYRGRRARRAAARRAPAPRRRASHLEPGGRRDRARRASRSSRATPRAARRALSLVLREGRKRQIRRSLAPLGHPVLRLVRVRIGPLRLRGLAPGAARALTAAERARAAPRPRARAQPERAAPRASRGPRAPIRRAARKASKRPRNSRRISLIFLAFRS